MKKTPRPISSRSARRSREAGKTSGSGSHIQRENTPWEISIPNHEPRKDSDTYKIARKVMSNVVTEIKDFFLGKADSYQDHHGGGLWVDRKSVV